MKASLLDILPEVKTAIDSGKPVVALESTIISHGMPYPKNKITALSVEAIVKEYGATPATIAILGGRLKVGLTEGEIDYLGKQGSKVDKASRRDIPFLVAGRKDGATTVAATMIIAEMAGISVFATGGIGGVHREGERTMDISADLQELAKTNVAVVCAGAKSILDIGLTLEYLETHGVPVIGYQTNEFPSFYSRISGFSVDYRIDNIDDLAHSLAVKGGLHLRGGAVVANPIPVAFQMDHKIIEDTISQALVEAKNQKIKGKAITPFLLSRIEQLTKGDSLKSNIQLVYNNAKVAAQLAVSLAKT